MYAAGAQDRTPPCDSMSLAYRPLMIDGKAVQLLGIDISDFPADSAGMEDAFHWMKRHFFNAIRLSTPQPPLFYELCDRYGFYVLDPTQTCAFPWHWRSDMGDHAMILENFSPIRLIWKQDSADGKEYEMVNGFEYTLEAVDLCYQIDHHSGKLSLDPIPPGESPNIVIPVSQWNGNYRLFLVVREPFKGFRKGDVLWFQSYGKIVALK